MGHTRTREHYSAVNMDEALTQAPMWMNQENITRRERTKSQKTMYVVLLI